MSRDELQTDLASEVAATGWYHTLELPGGIVTKGWFDHRSVIDRVPVPASLQGRRCLDVGTCDGYWAFLLERRGADEVVGIDLDDPYERDQQGAPTAEEDRTHDNRRARTAFAIAHAAYDSKVDRRALSVYDLDPGLVGEFDFVFIGSLLLHLRDPVGALMAIRRVLRPGATVLSFDSVSPLLTILRPRTPAAELWKGEATSWWWTPNMAAYHHYFTAAGYDVQSTGRPVRLALGEGHPLRQPATRSAVQRVKAARRRAVGAPSAWVIATPS